MHEDVFIKNNRGLKLSATVHHSANKSYRKLALILPGFLDSKDYLNISGLSNSLTELGYTAVRFNPSGTWDSEGKIEDYSMTQYLEDIKSVYNFMVKNGKVEYKKILIAGHSLGGMMSIIYSARNKSIGGTIAIMSPQKLVRTENFEERAVKWKKEKIKISKRDIPNNKDKFVEFKVPFVFVEDSFKYDILVEVSKIRKPVLILAGELDSHISLKQAKEVYLKANRPKQFIVVKGIGHDYRFSNKEVKLVNKYISDFIIKYNL